MRIGLIGAGNNHGIKTKNETGERNNYRPTNKLTLVHVQSFRTVR